jgi:hypothetical protein
LWFTFTMAANPKIQHAAKYIRGVKLVYIIIAIVIIAILVLRACLAGIVKSYVNKKLNELPGYTGHVEDIDIHLFRGAYGIDSLILKKKTDPGKYPFLEIAHTDLSLEWGALFKGRLVGVVELDRPIINILTTEEVSKEPSKDSWTKALKALMPININKLQINDGRFAYLDFQKTPNTNLHIDKLQVTALNLENVEKKGDALPSTLNFSGTSIGDGRLKADMKVNILKEIPDFNGGLQLTGVNLLALNNFLEANAKFDIEKGNIDIFSKVKLINSEMDGFVKPFISNLKVLDVKKDIKKKGGVLRVAKKAVIGLFAKVVKNPKTQKIATIIPIHGNIKDPKTNGWTTFVGILKNAFVQAFHESLSNELKAKEPDGDKK